MADPWALLDRGSAPAVKQSPWAALEPVGTEVPLIKRPPLKTAETYVEAMTAGAQDSSMGWMARGKAPNIGLADDAPWTMRAARNVGSVAGDFIPGVAAAIAATPTGPVGQGAAGFGVPMAIRAALVEAYTNNHALDWKGFWDISKAALIAGGKGMVIGGATMGAGKLVAGGIANTAGKAVAGTGAELTAMTTMAAALEGHIPTWQDFMDNAILLGGLKGVVGTAKGLYGIYEQAGRTPSEVLADASKNPKLAEQVAAAEPAAKAAQVALKDWATADAKVAKLIDDNASHGEVQAARREAKAAKKLYDAAAEKALELPDAYKELGVEERVNATLGSPEGQKLLQAVRRAEDPMQATFTGPVPFEYIIDKATAERVVRAVAAEFKDGVETQRRGTVKVGQSMAEATDLIREGKIKPHEIGDAANSGEVAARALLARVSAENTQRLVDALPSDPAQHSLQMKLKVAASMEQTAMFYKDLAGASAEIGRALNMLGQLKRNPALLAEASTMVKMFERKLPFTDLVAAIKELKNDPNAMRAFAESYKWGSPGQMALHAWLAAVLSGIHTTGANIIGGVTRIAAEVVDAPVAAAVEAATSAAKGQAMHPALVKAKAFGPIYGILGGAKDAVIAMGTAWKGEGGLLHYDIATKPLPGKVGQIVELPFRWLRAQDAFFRTFGERAKANELAVARALKEGWKPETREFNQAVSDYTKKPQAGLTAEQAAKVTEAIDTAGREYVLGEVLGPRMAGFSHAVEGSPAKLVIPFIRFPTNALSWSMQHIPGLNFMSSRWRADFAAGGAQQARAIARVSVGTGLTMFAFSLAEQGILTGSGLFDQEMRGTKQGAKWQANSFFIDGQYYSLERLEPISKVLITAANIHEMLNAKGLDDNDKKKLGAMAVLLFANTTISTSYMSGLANAMKASLEPNRHLEGFLEGYAMSLVPKIVGQTVAAFDPYKREVDGVVDAIQSQLPFFRQQLPPMRDVWGGEVPNEKLFGVLPVQTVKGETDKVKTEAVRLQIALADAPRWTEEKGPFKTNQKQTKMEPEQRDIWRQESGKFAMEFLSPLVNSQAWDSLPDAAQAKAYQWVFEKAHKFAEMKAAPPDSEARQKMQQQLADRLDRQIREAETGTKPKPGERRVK